VSLGYRLVNGLGWGWGVSAAHDKWCAGCGVRALPDKLSEDQLGRKTLPFSNSDGDKDLPGPLGRRSAEDDEVGGQLAISFRHTKWKKRYQVAQQTGFEEN